MKIIAVFALSSAALLAACGGGGSNGAVPSAGSTGTAPPKAAATAVPSTTPQTLSTNSFISGTSRGSIQAFSTVSSGKTVAVYVFDSDLTTGTTMEQTTCLNTTGCEAVWPPVTPPAGTTLELPWGSITRPDGLGAQLTFNGRPLYMYAPDLGNPTVAAGDGIDPIEPQFYWHAATAQTVDVAAGPPSPSASPAATATPY
jgi:predicted lipoprotein with Yx(FWY)xxD motif